MDVPFEVSVLGSRILKQDEHENKLDHGWITGGIVDVRNSTRSLSVRRECTETSYGAICSPMENPVGKNVLMRLYYEHEGDYPTELDADEYPLALPISTKDNELTVIMRAYRYCHDRAKLFPDFCLSAGCCNEIKALTGVCAVHEESNSRSGGRG